MTNMDNKRWEITVSVPADLPLEMRDDLFDRVTETVNAWEPEDRDQWDTFVGAGIED